MQKSGIDLFICKTFDTSYPNFAQHLSSVLKDKGLDENPVIKDCLTTTTDGKNYSVSLYSVEMILTLGATLFIFNLEDKGNQFFRMSFGDELH